MALLRVRLTCPGVALGVFLLACAPRAYADVVPPLPEPRCEPGYVIARFHSGPACVRPTCNTDADCPSDLRCTPRRCMAWHEIPGCRGATPKEPPEPADPCRELVELGPCTAETVCGGDAWCPSGRCLPPDEIAALSVPASALPEPGHPSSDADTAIEGASPEAEPGGTSETGSAETASTAEDHTEPPRSALPATAPRSGGGCCGSRGARTSAASVALCLGPIAIVVRKRRRGRA